MRTLDKRRRASRRARKSEYVVLGRASEASHSVAATARIGWLVVDTGATKGMVGHRAYTTYKEALAAVD